MHSSAETCAAISALRKAAEWQKDQAHSLEIIALDTHSMWAEEMGRRMERLADEIETDAKRRGFLPVRLHPDQKAQQSREAT